MINVLLNFSFTQRFFLIAERAWNGSTGNKIIPAISIFRNLIQYVNHATYF